ncbi:MAG: VCBS repeat-containing protein [Bacteroidetes bacterium]|nr:VCBS repeat-containing protein [Bacteroidota bacterium]
MRSRIGIIPICLLVLAACKGRPALFERIPSSQSGIGFNNRIVENDSVNPLNLINLYNGGGVGIGDFNRDGKPDIYFTGSVVSNRLYLNKGDFRFQDITGEAGVTGEGRWSRGVAVVDINNDGWPDIYVCTTISSDPAHRRNLLYINQGSGKDGIPHFKEMAHEYGLDDTTHSTMAAFFDYDKDGDLDVFIAVNIIPKDINPGQFRPKINDGSFPSTCRLYRNDWNAALKHPVFTDVSHQAGILHEGYSHGVTIADLNRDGWEDIYVSNDFISENALYINNHDGTFTERSAEYFKHTAANAMGQDIVDINNDGLADIIELDMNPEDNYRKKMMLGANNYHIYQNSDQYGYQYQYVRNVLQLNRGPRIGPHDSIGAPVFSDIAFYAGIAETDWSWTPAVADFDNDGYRDIIITNGYPKDVTDHDFTTFLNQASGLASRDEILSRIPQVKLHKYAYRNENGLRFSDVSSDWGLTTTAFSNGTVYADLDGDGDLDLVMNNINDEAMIFRNLSREKDTSRHYLQFRLLGDSLNRDGLGARVELHYDHGHQQVMEYTPYRGYLSTMQEILHFGLGTVRSVDTILVEWPGGKEQVIKDLSADRLLTLDIRNAVPAVVATPSSFASTSLFHDITDSADIHYVHEEMDFIDFNVQKLLPHKLSEYGPALAVGDIDGNGLDDLVSGGSAYHSAQLFLQQPNGRYIQKALLPDSVAKTKKNDDLGLLLFDADGDGDLDLYIASGGYEYTSGSMVYADRLYVNNGKGQFIWDSNALPPNMVSKLCVRAADFDHDGDLDLFVSGRVDPGHYPQPVSSFIYRNDSKNGKIEFTDVTAQVAPDLISAGMICDALWTDYDNDGWPDLLLAGEWMPLTLLRNEHGRFKNMTAGAGLSEYKGWWNTLAAGDFDNDGDIDYIAGNLGENSFFRATAATPARAYGKDFDNNGIYDLVTSLYLPDSTGVRREFPAEGRDDLLRQMNSLRLRFPDYRSFAVATMDQVLTPEQRKGALILEANEFRSCFLRNDGAGRFTLVPLPSEAQWSAINGMCVADFDGDGQLDVVMNGNDYGTEVSTGRYDAFNGLYLSGDGRGGFRPRSILESGIYIPGNGKALVRLRGRDGASLVAASQNRGPLKVFALRRFGPSLALQPADVSLLVHYRDGHVRREEVYYGASFLSQSARIVDWTRDVISVEITDNLGRKRQVRSPL